MLRQHLLIDTLVSSLGLLLEKCPFNTRVLAERAKHRGKGLGTRAIEAELGGGLRPDINEHRPSGLIGP